MQFIFFLCHKKTLFLRSFLWLLFYCLSDHKILFAKDCKESIPAESIFLWFFEFLALKIHNEEIIEEKKIKENLKHAT